MSNERMKAYYVTDEPNRVYGAIVFAETRNKARVYASRHDDIIGETEYVHVRATRFQQADKLYRGKPMLDWEDDEDRLLMVKELGCHCDDEVYDSSECERCYAKEYCTRDYWEE